MTFQSRRNSANKDLRLFSAFFLGVPLLFASACGGGGGSTPPVSPTITSVSISCTSSSVQTGQTSQCSATVTGTGSYSSAVTWSAVSGTISSSGLYTAPAAVPASGSDTITATSTQDSTKAGSAKVTVTAIPVTITSVAVACSPTSILATQTSTCTPTVTGTGNFSSAVTWSVSPSSIGAVSSAGIFAPAATGTATVMATSAQDTTQSGTATVAVNPLPTPTTPLIVPSILLSGSPTQVTVSSFVKGASQNTQVQLFSLAGGSPILVGNMADNGQNGDPVAGDQVYSIATTLTAPAASSLPLQVVATTGTAGTVSANFSVQVVQIPSYATNAAINQAEAQIYSTAVQTRTIFTNPNWSTPNVLQEISGNLISMFSQFAGVANQNTALQSASIGLKGIRRAGIQSNNVHSEGIGQDILNFLSLGFFSPAQSGQSCDQLVQSFGPLRSTSTLPLLDPNDPNLKALADELVDLCPSDIQCPGPITEDDLLGNYNLVAAEWAVQYLSIGPPLPTPIAGCNGGTGKTLANVGVKADLEQFTDLTGAGLTTALGSGEISQQLIGQANDTLVGFAVDSSGNSRVMIGQAAPNETFAVPAGTYNLAASFGGDTANATITNTPVYPNSITNISPLPGIILWLDPPEIQSFSPTFGPVGTPVTLSGYGFNPPSGSLTSINFNGANATVPSATDSSMTVVVPPGATTGPITVITTVGETTSSISFTVTASAGNPVPTIAGLNPSSLAAGAAPQTLTINGTGFLDSSTVTFNGISHAATFVNAGQLTISLTSADLATVGTYPVVVTNPAPGGGASIAKSFNVTNGQTANEWTWMSGADTAGQLGVYGTQGVPSVANVPGSRTEAASWTDSSGNFWLFGGATLSGTFNDLWRFNPTNDEWTWMSGSSSMNQPGVYGTQGVPAAANVPGSRGLATSWTDSNGNLWLFGGSTDTNDLWQFSPATQLWTWISGSGSYGTPGVYGTQGVPAATNVPGGRNEALGWIDSNGNLWLFGGSGYDSAGVYGELNDLWEFNPTTKMWTWVSGSSSMNQLGVYGTQGVPAATNVPGGRNGAISWTDTGGSLWLFGGNGFDGGNDSGGLLNDLWEFQPTTKKWTWVSGSSSANQPGVYGTQGVPAATNIPGGREYAVSWIDGSGNLWLFGGGYNDLWEYSPTTNLWTWVSGSSSGSHPGVYGTESVPAATNVPGTRESSATWVDGSGNLWLFGGAGSFSGGEELNDLWRYQP